MVDFIKPGLTAVETGKLRMALKSRYDETTWLQTLKEVMDAIRPAKRDALVAYLLATRPEFSSANDLYDQWLIDVEMEACMPSSRIVLAHNSIQLFVQRCMMGLEPSAAANTETDSGWRQWKWLSQYRVREANMKVWCYPENWIEAELRDDKSFIFQDLENELMQNELTEFTAEHALTHYLEQLDSLAFLEVVATWYQAGSAHHARVCAYQGRRPRHLLSSAVPAGTLLDAVGQSRPGNYGRPVVGVLAQPAPAPRMADLQRGARPQPASYRAQRAPGTVVNTDKPKRKLKIQLAVSELADGVWQPKRISKDTIRTPDTYTTEPSSKTCTTSSLSNGPTWSCC